MASRPEGGILEQREPSLDAALREALVRLRSRRDFEDAFRILDARLRPRLFRYFRSHSFAPEDAEDLVQKTLERVYKGVAGLVQEEKFWPWLFTIARNVRRTAYVEMRREGRAAAAGSEEFLYAKQTAPPADEAYSEHSESRLAAIWAAVQELPEQQRRCLSLRVREEMSYEEIAGTLRLTVHTVRNHLAAAKQNLREMLREEIDVESDS